MHVAYHSCSPAATPPTLDAPPGGYYCPRMAEDELDLIAIGAGSGGVAASRRASSYGARVALIESHDIGGTCVLRGCVPKKLLMYGSRVSSELADARGFGYDIPQPTFS